MGKVLPITDQLNMVEAVKNNDETVLKQLYHDCYVKVEAHILKNNGTKAQAKDVFQEAFIATWQNVKNHSFVPVNETALQGYLYQISKNKWTDFLRSSRYKKTTKIADGFQIEDDQNGVEVDSQKEENMTLTMTAFKKLGAECKELLTHFYFEKKSLREIASKLDIGEASARNKKYRCINKLRELALSPK